MTTYAELKVLLEKAYNLPLRAIEKKYFKKNRLDTLEGIMLAIYMICNYPDQATGCNTQMIEDAVTQ